MTTNPILTDPEMAEIVESFIVETKEILENLDVDLMMLEKNADDLDLLNKIFRAFHTIKGTSGFLGLERLTKVTHCCEDILNKLRKQEVTLSTPIMDAIFLAYDTIKSLSFSIERNNNEDVPIEATVEQLNSIIHLIEKGESPSAVSIVKKESSTKKTITPKKTNKIPKAIAARKTKPETKEIPRPKSKVKTKKILTPKTVAERNSSIEEVVIHETVDIKSELTKENSVPEVSASKPVYQQQAFQAAKSDNTIRVNIERLDDLLNIVSELVLGRNRLAQVNAELSLNDEGSKLVRDLADATKQIDLMTNELQSVVMKTRMVRIGKVFNKFPRLVRDLAKDSGKEIQLIVKGEETELDKTLIEEINDPLVHLIRNSVDHGVELPSKRTAAGKPAMGTITLSAEHDGNNIIISIEDDGNGINPDKIKEKAVAKGLITIEKAMDLSRQEALNLIFLPGFSTAEVVTNVSGRGVGMDVVKTNVTKLRGIINIESMPGLGTKIIVKLPLTLAIIPGMIVKINSEQLVIPLNSVLEVLRVNVDNIYSINQHEVIRMRDVVLPLISIEDLLCVKSNGGKVDKTWQYVVVIGIAEKKFGIKVDQLIGQKEVVIKSLGSFLGNIHGIAGSTIMGDGTVVMILDLSELINRLAE